MSVASSLALRRPRRTRLVTVAVILASLATVIVATPPVALAAASDTPTESWVTNGDVNAVTQAAGRVYLGGSFDQVGPNTGSGVALDPGGGSWSPTFPKVNGVVYVAVPDGAGGFYIGGDFTRVGDKSRQNGARILADGTVGNWNPNTDLPVRAIVLSPNAKTAWIGGDFTTLNKALNPVPAAGLAATNLFSGAVIWTLPSVTVGSVSTLALSADGSRLYAGGSFTSLAGVARARLAALDAGSGAVDASFNPGADGAVNAVAPTADGRLIVGGDFTHVGGAGRSRLAAITSAGAVDDTWQVGADGRVDVLTPTADGSRLFVGGDFATIGGVPRRRLAALSTRGAVSVDPTWDPGVAGAEVRAIAVTLDGSRIYAGGGDDTDDPSVTGAPRRFLVAIDATGTVDTTFDPRPAAATEALALSSSLVFAGGQFTSVNGVARANLAALDAASGALDPGFVADTDGAVNALASDGTSLYAGGVFSAVNGTTRRRLVQVDAATGVVAAGWQTTASAEVDSLLLAGPQLYVGGTFSSLGGASRAKIGRVSTDTGAVDDWNPTLDAAAQGIRLAPDQQSVYVAGDFSVIGTTPRQKLAAIDVSTGLATAWYPKPKVPLTGVAISGDGSLAFVPTRGSRTAGNRIQAYSTVSGALVWEQLGDGDFQAVDVSGSLVYTGGHFTEVGKQVRGHLAAFDQQTGAIQPWAPVISGVHGVLALQVTADSVLVGGQFHKVSGVVAQGFARFSTDGGDAPPTTTTTRPTPTTTTTRPAVTTTTTAPTTTTTAPGGSVGVTTAASRSGYWMVGADGAVYPFGDARSFGNATVPAGAAAVDLEPTPSGQGYWVVDSRGGVSPFGDAARLGGLGSVRLVTGESVTSLSATPSGKGYWIFTTRGRAVPVGDAAFFGDMSAVALNGPVLDSIPTPTGHGYYMVASDGGIFAFGDARFYGSMGGRKLNAPVQSLVPDGDGAGYWLVASDGGIFAFEAPFKGSMGATRLNRPVTGMVRFGDGYLMVGEDGGIFNFSSQPFAGSLGAHPPARPIVSVAALD